MSIVCYNQIHGTFGNKIFNNMKRVPMFLIQKLVANFAEVIWHANLFVLFLMGKMETV